MTSFTVNYNEPVTKSAASSALYHVYEGVKKVVKRHKETVFTKLLKIKSVSPGKTSSTVTINLAKPFKRMWAYESDEFESAACMGLVQAAQAFDPSKRVKFSTFAAKRILGEAAASEAGHWMDESLKRMNQVGEEGARARHAQWTKKIDGDLQQALARMEARQRELEVLAEKLTMTARERLEGAVETARTDAVGRIVARLKEQSAPVIDEARKVAAELTKREQDLGKMCEQFIEKSSVEIEEACTRLDRQFEMILRERLDSAREELERTAQEAVKVALHGVRVSAVQQETESQARLQHALEPVMEGALASLKEKAAEMSRQFASEMSHYSRSHLEFVGGAISELAKGIGKLSGD